MAEDTRADDLTWRAGSVRAANRGRLLVGQAGSVVWLTGLTGLGRTALVRALAKRLSDPCRYRAVVDGKNARLSFSRGVGCSAEDHSGDVDRASGMVGLPAWVRLCFAGVRTYIEPMVVLSGGVFAPRVCAEYRRRVVPLRE